MWEREKERKCEDNSWISAFFCPVAERLAERWKQNLNEWVKRKMVSGGGRESLCDCDMCLRWKYIMCMGIKPIQQEMEGESEKEEREICA
jgi:hypothetical protein